jgi:hypothetical protein
MLNATGAATHKRYSRDAVFLSGYSKCAIPYRFLWRLHVGLTFYIRKFYYWDRTNLCRSTSSLRYLILLRYTSTKLLYIFNNFHKTFYIRL